MILTQLLIIFQLILETYGEKQERVFTKQSTNEDFYISIVFFVIIVSYLIYHFTKKK